MDWRLQHCAHRVTGWIAEYEGFFEADEQLLTELITIARKLLKIEPLAKLQNSTFRRRPESIESTIYRSRKWIPANNTLE
jgi:hypothetical protein